MVVGQFNACAYLLYILSDCSSLVQDTSILIPGVHGKGECRHSRMLYATLSNTDPVITIDLVDVNLFKFAWLGIPPDILCLCVFAKLVWVILWKKRHFKLVRYHHTARLAQATVLLVCAPTNFVSTITWSLCLLAAHLIVIQHSI